MEFISFQKEHLREVLTLANNALGDNYLTASYLKEYLNTKNYLAFVLINDQCVIGFTSLVILNPIELKKNVLNENEWFYERTKNHPKIALRKQTIVHPNFINQGIGTKLVELSSKEIKTTTSLQLSTVWKKENENSMGKLLLKNDFTLIKTIPNYWKKNSLINNYNCLICGLPPCKCAAEVYIKKKCTN